MEIETEAYQFLAFLAAFAGVLLVQQLHFISKFGLFVSEGKIVGHRRIESGKPN